MRRFWSHLVAVVLGVLVGGGGLAVAAGTGNLPLQTWLGVQSVNRKIGTYGDGSPISVMGQLDSLRRQTDAAWLEAMKACRAAGGV
jgi:hypothetical protein